MKAVQNLGSSHTRWLMAFLLVGFTMTGFSQYVPPLAPPDLNANVPWNNWYYYEYYPTSYPPTVSAIQDQFNIGRRAEETQLGLASGTLGDLYLPSDFLERSFDEQALILLNLERTARDGVDYGNGPVSGMKFEGIEPGINAVAQAHADDMQDRDYFAHDTQGEPPGNWATRVRSSVPSGCDEGISENISWNGIDDADGFVFGVPLAIYGFIYDDACCGWGHRRLCLRQTGDHSKSWNATRNYNNYGEPDRYGLVGFGRATGSNGDYFVMDFIDPVPSCTYTVITYEDGMQEVLTLSGNIETGFYEAMIEIQADGYIENGSSVSMTAGESINLFESFEVELGAELEVYPENMSGLIISSSNILATPMFWSENSEKNLLKKSHIQSDMH